MDVRDLKVQQKEMAYYHGFNICIALKRILTYCTVLSIFGRVFAVKCVLYLHVSYS